LACLGWLCQTPRSRVGYLGVPTLHTFKINIFLWLHRRPTSDIATLATTSSTPSSFNAPFKTLLGILGYWALLIRGLFVVGTPTRPPLGWPRQTPCSYARRFGCLYTSFDQDHDSVFFSFEHQTSHVACFNARGLLYECVFYALLFSLSYRPVGKPVSHHVVTRPTFSSFVFGSSDRPSYPPRCSDTTI
jgi:hypothetical protein